MILVSSHSLMRTVASMTHRAASILIAVVLASCAETDSGEALDPTVLTYRLLAESEVVATSAGGDDSRREALSGEFDVGCHIPRNAGFSFQITRMNLRSETLSVSGSEGAIRDSTFVEFEPRLQFWADVVINGVELRLSGGGSTDSYTFDPIAFRGIQATGGDYALTINAEPIGDRVCCIYDPNRSDCAPLYQ